MKKFKLNNLPTLRISFFIFNILLLLIGIAYIGIGAWLIDTISNVPNIDDLTYYYGSLGGITITVGVLSAFLAFFGFLVSFLKGLKVLIVYLVLIVHIMLFGVAVGIVGLSYSSNVPNQISNTINFSYFNSTSQINVQNVDYIQSAYECCGVNLPSDWQNVLARTSYPNSCCEDATTSCTTPYKIGCFKAIQNMMSLDMSTCGGISLGIALPMLIGVAIMIALIVEYEDLKLNTKYSISR